MRNTTIVAFWNEHLAPLTKELGVSEGDESIVRAAAKNVLISAGWATPTGAISFVSEKDQASAIAAAKAEVSRVGHRYASERAVEAAALRPGFTPTMASVLAASAAPVELVPVSAGSNNLFTSPKVGDSCPRCSGKMDVVELVNDKCGLYCTKDRIVLPLPSGVSS